MPRGIPGSGKNKSAPAAKINPLQLMQAAVEALSAVPKEFRSLVVDSVVEKRRRGRKPGRKPGTKVAAKTAAAPAKKVRAKAAAKAKASGGNGKAAAPSVSERKKQRAAEILSEGT